MITPKYSLQVEEIVLMSIMNWGQHTHPRVQKAMLQLDNDCFYNPSHAVIFAMIKKAFNLQQPFDFVTILVSIDRGEDTLQATQSDLIQNFKANFASDANFESYVQQLVTLAMLRKQLALAQNMIKDVHECGSPEKAHSILSAAISEISGLSYQEDKSGISGIEIAEAYYDGKIVEPKPMPTSCEKLNYLLGGGVMPKALIFAAAAPSTGKTGFAIYMLDAIARMQAESESLFFSLEMEYKHIWMRHIGICAGSPFDKLTDKERLVAVTKSAPINLRVYDTNMCKRGADIEFIVNTARIRAMQHKIAVIAVDYVGLVKVKGKFERHDLKMTEITDQLGQLAIELDCTVIALSQINRQAALRGDDDRCPWPNDAANSSGGHNSASYWLGLDRPEIYRQDREYANQFVVKCRKNRFGDLNETIYGFNAGTFGNYNKPPYAKVYAPLSHEEKVFS